MDHGPRTNDLPDGRTALRGLRSSARSAANAAHGGSVEVQSLGGSVLDELVLGAPNEITAQHLESALARAGGRRVFISPTTPVVLVDGQTRALSLATRVVGDTSELPEVLAELLGAEHIDGQLSAGEIRDFLDEGTILKVPSPSHGVLLFWRRGEPFTPIESGRAHRLAELAEMADSLSAAQHGGGGGQAALSD